MCTFEYPFGDPTDWGSKKKNEKVFLDYKRKVTNEDCEPNYSFIPKKYSKTTVEFIKRFLEKDWKSRPYIKDVIDELEEHAEDIFSKSGENIELPPSWNTLRVI